MGKEISNRIKQVFSDLQFEEKEHVYKVNNEVFTPVSNIVKKFEVGFDTHQKAIEYSEKHGIPYDEVIAMWGNSNKSACDLGHDTHFFAERYFDNRNLKPSNGFEIAVVNFWNSLPRHIIPISSESRMFSSVYKYAGTSDNLFYNTITKKIIISDYKTNKNLFKNFRGQTLLFPFDHLLDSPFNKYQIQLSLYQILIEDIGYDVEERWIVWLKPDGKFEKYETQDLTKDLRKIISKVA